MPAHQPTGKTVLVVDDEEHLRMISSRLMEFRGHRALVAENGQQAVDILSGGQKVDLVIMDVRMPVLDGFEALIRIRNDLKMRDLPVVMLTAQRSDQDLMTGYGVGADYYLTKPFKYEQLERVVDYFVGDLSPDQRVELEKLL